MNDTIPLISIIIPVYNDENCIEQCICSVINQSYKNIEVIIVNDGSTDRSIEIIEKHISIDTRLTCINQPNKGANLARKAGLEISKGKYIQYLDGDDTLFTDAIERLVERAEVSSADIVSAPFIFCYKDGRKIKSPILAENELYGIDYFRKIFKWEGATWNMWSNFQKRSLFYDYNVDVISDIPYGEDASWMIQIFFHNPKIAVEKTPTIYYNQNMQSVSYNKAAAPKRYKGACALYQWFYGFLKKQNLENNFGKELAIMQMNMTFICIRTTIFDKVGENMDTLIENMNLFPDLTKDLPKPEKIMIFMFRKSYILFRFCLFCYKIKKQICI